MTKKNSLIKHAFLFDKYDDSIPSNVTSQDVFEEFKRKYNVAKNHDTYRDFIDKGDDRYTPENLSHELALDYNHNHSKWKSFINFISRGPSSLVLPLVGSISGALLSARNPKLGKAVALLSSVAGPITGIADEYAATRMGLNVIKDLNGNPNPKHLKKKFGLNVLKKSPALIMEGLSLGLRAAAGKKSVPNTIQNTQQGQPLQSVQPIQSAQPTQPVQNYMGKPDINASLVGLGIGAGLGAGVGYLTSDKKKNSKLKDTLTGAAALGLGGASAGYLYDKHKYPKMVQI